MRVDSCYAFGSFLPSFHESYRLFFHTNHSAGAWKL